MTQVEKENTWDRAINLTNSVFEVQSRLWPTLAVFIFIGR